MPTAHILSFTGEHGRNPARVFGALRNMLDAAQEGDAPVIHVFTHAALYIPRELVQQIRLRAQMVCVFMLPSGGQLTLDYLDLLNAHWAVDHDALSDEKRAGAAREILADVAPSYSESEQDDEAANAAAAMRSL